MIEGIVITVIGGLILAGALPQGDAQLQLFRSRAVALPARLEKTRELSRS